MNHTSPTTPALHRTPAWLLPALLVSGALLGFVIGGFFGPHWKANDWPFFIQFLALLGEVFMNLLRMLVVPFVITSMILGMTSMGRQGRVGRLLGVTFTYYMVTTILAVILGIVVVLVVDPGGRYAVPGGTAGVVHAEQLLWYEALFKTVRSLFPDNIFQAAAQGQILGLITFSLIFGAILRRLGERGEMLVRVIDVVNDVLMTFVHGVIWLAPLGILGLVATKTGAAGGFSSVISDLRALSLYAITVLAGLGVHAVIVLPAILWGVARRNPIQHLRHFSEAVVTAFSTASSAATIPVTTANALDKAGFGKSNAQFVLPLGATINMDGTALYEAVAVIFIASTFGIKLGITQIVVVALTATLAAIGAAAIPHAGLVTMVMVFAAADVPPDIANKGIAMILTIDWILDRFRTAVNVWGDTVGLAVVERLGSVGSDGESSD